MSPRCSEIVLSLEDQGSHAIQLTNSSREAECGRLGRICGGVVQRNFQVDSVQIEAAIFLDATITSTVNLTGQVGMMQVKLQQVQLNISKTVSMQ